MSIKVFTVADALHELKTNPSTVFIVEKKKEDKVYNNTRYLNLKWNIGSFKNKDGWFTAKDVRLSAGVADPSDKEDYRNEYDGAPRMHLETTVSNAGELGEFIDLLDKELNSRIQQLVDDGTIVLGKRELHGLVQRIYSDNNKKNPGGVIEDPRFKFKVDFGVYSPKYPIKSLAGKPKSQFLDYRTRFTDETGVERYLPAVVIDDSGNEVPVNKENFHKFVTAGSIIKKFRFNINSIAVSKGWVSCPMMACQIVLDPGAEEGFDDEAPEPALKTALAPKTVAVTDDEPETKPDTTDVTDQDVDDLLANI